VSRYNIGLGIALKIIKLLLALRQQDVEIRKQKAEELKKEREEKLAENEKIEEDKVNAL
jgi:DNA-binding transcriptional MerR regulator